MEQLKITAREAKKMGLKLHEIPVPDNFFNVFNREGQVIMATLTYPVVRKRILSYYIIFPFLIAGILLMFLGGEAFGQIGLIFMLASAVWVLGRAIKLHNLINGYLSLNGEMGALLFILSIPLFIFGLITQIIVYLICVIFKADAKEKAISMKRVALPAGMGLDYLIESGEAFDKLTDWYNTLLEMSLNSDIEYNKNELKEYDDALKEIDKKYNTASYEEQKEYDAVKKELKEERERIEKEYKDMVKEKKDYSENVDGYN